MGEQAGGGEEGPLAAKGGYDARQWQNVSARRARFGGSGEVGGGAGGGLTGSDGGSTALLGSTGAARAPKVPNIGSRALCSWALEQRDVLEGKDAKALCDQLRR